MSFRVIYYAVVLPARQKYLALPGLAYPGPDSMGEQTVQKVLVVVADHIRWSSLVQTVGS
jgi:hypothetical protein